MSPRPVFLEHPSSLAHDTGSHPERAERLVAIARQLEHDDWFGFARIQSPAAQRSRLEAVHPRAYVERIEAVSQAGGGQLDLDTLMSERSFEAALHAAGGAITLVELILAGEAPTGFSVHRPPGHHALVDTAMGFCLFNNVAIAARHAIDVLGLERVLILDWDVHHGNGTNDIFHTSDQVLFVSIHQHPLYPGTGPARDVGSGAGEGFTVNLPVPPGSDDIVYRSLVEHVVAPLAREFGPQLLLISAGYDAHHEDPLAECHVTEEGFAQLTRSVRRIARETDAALGFVLEGGYALEPLARSVAATMSALIEPLGDDSQAAEVPFAREARARLAQWWPALR